MKCSIIVINKNDKGIEQTLKALYPYVNASNELIVVDNSNFYFEYLRNKYKKIHWIDFSASSHLKATIPEQRNAGIRAAKGYVIVFIDASCVPSSYEWLEKITTPILKEKEMIVRGSVENISNHVEVVTKEKKRIYVSEAPTINLAISRRLFETIGYFDEDFSYGSDVDFTWRAVKRGYKIRYIEKASVSHDFGDNRENARRYTKYGKARAQLYAKHPYNLHRFRGYELSSVIYTVILLLSPISFFFPIYLFILVFFLIYLLKGKSTKREIVERVFFSYGLLLGVVQSLQRAISPK